MPRISSAEAVRTKCMGDEVALGVARLAVADHLAGLHVESREE